MSSIRIPLLPKLVFLLLFVPCVVPAAEVSLGYVFFDNFQPGLNAITIFNFTGDPLLGGTALTPDFPVYAPVTFQASSLTIIQGASSQTFFLGDLLPGTYSPPSLVFADSGQLSSAIFTATLSTDQLLLDSGLTLVSASTDLTAYLNPSGSYLAPGDFVLISVADGPTPGPSTVPEPSTIILICCGLAVAVLRHAVRMNEVG